MHHTPVSDVWNNAEVPISFSNKMLEKYCLLSYKHLEYKLETHTMRHKIAYF